MANKVSISFNGFEDLYKKLGELNDNIESVTEEVLKESFDIVQSKTKNAMQKKNLPAKGKYSTGDTENSIIADSDVKWEGTIASIAVGFDLKKSGIKSILLMYGTPKMKPSKGLKNAIYGSKTKKEISDKQKGIFEQAIKEAIEK